MIERLKNFGMLLLYITNRKQINSNKKETYETGVGKITEEFG